MSKIEIYIDWSKKNILKIGNEINCLDDVTVDDIKKYRMEIEPWLTAIFQSEHLSLLIGSGLTIAVSSIAGITSQTMKRIDFENEFKEKIKQIANKQAQKMKRGKPNIEDDLRVAIELYKGLLIADFEKANKLKSEIDEKLLDFIKNILKNEYDFLNKLQDESDSNGSNQCREALLLLKTFLISFSSRTASRDRLHIFTTNYDRFIEYACDDAGILTLDSFTGKINPILRANKIALDYHYNPPGIRGEPRYVEGVIRYTKLHGSLDWKFDNYQIKKTLLPFGVNENHSSISSEPFDEVVIYPNSAKDIETVYFPYADLFREFSTAICQNNSTIVTYGYGFGDSHINRILEDMLTIPSTHVVIISLDYTDERIKNFFERNNPDQLTLIIGNHFGDLKNLTESYIPKAAIDLITERRHMILNKRGDEDFADGNKDIIIGG